MMEIAALFKHGHLESLLVLEIFSALLEDIDALSQDELDEISKAFKWMPGALEHTDPRFAHVVARKSCQRLAVTNLVACSALARPYLDSFEHDGTLGAS
jgi:hypothetical protein